MNGSQGTGQRSGRRGKRQAAPKWTARTLDAALRDAGYDRDFLKTRWDCSRTTVARVIGLQPNPLGIDFTTKRRDIAALLGVPFDAIKVAWDRPSAEVGA